MLAILSGRANAQSERTLHINIGFEKPGSYVTSRGKPDPQSVVVHGLLPSMLGLYDIKVLNVKRVGPPLQTPGVSAQLRSTAGTCPLTEAALKAAEKASTEGEFATLMNAANAAATSETATGNCTNSADLINAELEKTSQSLSIDQLADDADLVIDITRPNGTNATLEWKHTYAGTDQGEWRVLYAFATTINAWPVYTYSTVDTLNGKFAIQRARQRSPLSLIPALQYVFAGDKDDHFTAGLGVDLTKPSVLAAYTHTYFANLACSIGLALHQVKELNDKYSAGQLLSTNLDAGQLTQDVFHVDPFIAISFRFGSTPFSPPAPAARNGSGTKQTP